MGQYLTKGQDVCRLVRSWDYIHLAQVQGAGGEALSSAVRRLLTCHLA